MGKKGKMSRGSGDVGSKWANLRELRDISDSLAEARRTAYDHRLIDRKRSEQSGAERRKLIFPHLDYLVGERMYDDRRANASAVVDQDRGQYWQHLLTKTDVRNLAAEKARVSEESKARYYRSLIGAKPTNSPPPLSSICLETIGKYAEHYDPADLRFALDTLTHDKTELFSLLSCIHHTQTDALLPALDHEYVEKLYLSSKVSDNGLHSLLSNIKNSKYRLLDSWEQIDPTEITTSTSMGLREIYLLSSSVSLSSIELIRDSCLQLEKLSLHDVDFEQEKKRNDPAVLCLRFLDIVSCGFGSLHTLELLRCSWTHSEALMLWARRLAQQRCSQKAVLPCLTSLVVAVAKDALFCGPTADLSGHARYAELTGFLQSACGIAMTVRG
jgi:hypothetical protein